MGRSRPIRSQRMNPERERQELVPQNKKNWFFDSFFFNIKQKYGYVNKIYKRTELRLPATLYRLSLQRSQRFSQWEVAMVLPWHLGKQMTRWYRRICALSLSDVSWVIPFDVGPLIYPPTFPKIDLTSICLLDKRISQSQESLLHSTSI